MGCASSWACRTCKLHLYLGYGSCGRHEERVQKWAPVTEHDGHDTIDWIDDAEWGMENGTLYGMGPWGEKGHAMIEGLGDFTYRNLQSEREEEYRRAHPPKPLPETTGDAELDRKLKAWEQRKR